MTHEVSAEGKSHTGSGIRIPRFINRFTVGALGLVAIATTVGINTDWYAKAKPPLKRDIGNFHIEGANDTASALRGPAFWLSSKKRNLEEPTALIDAFTALSKQGCIDVRFVEFSHQRIRFIVEADRINNNCRLTKKA